MVDETPPLTPEQHSQLKGKMMVLESIYREERVILDNLLKLYPTNIVAFQGSAAVTYNDGKSTRQIYYTYPIWDAEENVEVEIGMFYQRSGYSARVSINVGDYSNSLAYAVLPIRDGMIEEATLKEFLMNNIFITMGRAIAQLYRGHNDT